MMKAVLDIPKLHAEVLSFLMERVPPMENLWVVTGSAGLRLQGVDIPVNDLDLQTDSKTVFLLEKELAEFINVPVHLRKTEHTFSYYGQVEIHGLQVELLGDIRHRQPNRSWSDSLDLESILVWVDWSNLNIPVISLEHEATAYEKLGRVQKAELIRSTIQKEIR